MKDSHEVQLGRDLTKTFNRDCHYSVSTLSTFFTILWILCFRVSGWQNTDIQGVCTLFWGWQGWQEGDRSARAQSENGQYNNCLPCPNSDEEPLFLWKNAPSGIKFSREFNAKCRAKQYFGRSKPPNSLENLTASCLQASSKRIIQDDFERLKL